MNIEIILSEQETEQFNYISKVFGKTVSDVVGELIRGYLKHFEGVENLEYTEVQIRGGGKTEIISVDSRDDIIALLINDLSCEKENESLSDEELGEKASIWLESVPDDGSVILLPGSGTFGIRKATEQEKYSYILEDSKSIEQMEPFVDMMMNGGFFGMSEKLKKLRNN